MEFRYNRDRSLGKGRKELKKKKTLRYCLRHFFTHNDYLPPASQLPGTLFTPLHFLFSATLLTAVVTGGVWAGRKRKHRLRKIFTVLWSVFLVCEVVIVAWESFSGKVKKLDLKTNLSLYPCSVYLAALPVWIWGRGAWQKMAAGYLTTIGMLGGAVNFLYPVTRLTYYSCISFPGFHTFFYHGAMLFTCISMLTSGLAKYRARTLRELFYPCIPCLLMSVPANLVNFSRVGSDYMFFRDSLGFLRMGLPGLTVLGTTLLTYGLYVIVPMLFFLPSYLQSRKSPVLRRA